MTQTNRWPTVVLGAGAVGAATAYHLAKRGEPVALIEQFGIGHDRGSSHGASRITRHSYADVRYARLMPLAFQAWRNLEADAGIPLYLRTGGVSLSPSSVDYVGQVAASLEAIGVPFRRMSGRDLKEKFPGFAAPDDTDVVFEPDAGLLAASKAVAAEVALAKQLSDKTVILDHLAVTRIELEGDKPTLITETGTIIADRLIVAAGSWARKLLPDLSDRLRPTRQCVFHFRPEDASRFSAGRFPVFIWKGDGEFDDFYGIPDHLGLGVKVAGHGGPDCDPETVDREIHHSDVVPVRRFLREILPDLADATLVSAEVCLYTMAPNDDFLVGPWSGRDDVFLASPCSGHGFKFSCLVGRVLADLAQTGRTDVDIAAWSTRQHS